MATSGSTNFNPSLGEVTLYAFNACQIRANALLQEHMTSARMAANLMQGRWSSAPGVNLWCVDLQSIPLVAGQATYPVDPSTIAMLDSYWSQDNGAGDDIDRWMLPVSRTEYSTYPNKNQQGTPTVYWFDRQLAPTVTLYPVPDGNQDAFNFYRTRYMQDAQLTNMAGIEAPVYFLEAYALGLAYRLAVLWAPALAQGLKALADEAFAIATDQNTETMQVYITPMISAYYR